MIAYRDTLSTASWPRLALALALLLLAVAAANARPPAGGRGFTEAEFADQVSPALWTRLAAEARANETALAKADRLPPHAKITGMRWPLAPTPGVGTDWHGVSNFVDLNPAFPNQLRDYTCAARTYDNAQGYNHGGTDMFIWPFPWTLMDAGAIDIVAAAPGTIVGKGDGNDDRSCSFAAPDTPNYVLVRHADGTVGVYLHMKRNSVTTKAVGSTVTAGEYLGKVGSSGISTGPHLHFEIRATTAGNAPAVDPFNGQCNSNPSGFTAQRPYRDSRLNRLTTHGTPPDFGTCPDTTDTPNLKTVFQRGDPIFFGMAFRDQGRGQVAQQRVLRPDGTVYTQWSFDMAETGNTPEFYNAALWLFDNQVPANAPFGTWAFESTYQGETKRTEFTVGSGSPTIADPRGLTGAWFNAATAGQGFEFHWVEPDRLLVLFYGHHDNGQNFYVIGTRDGRFAYGETITVSLAATLGGRFNNLDPNAITRPAWGTVTLRFDSCSSAQATLTGTDGTQTLTLQPLTRQPGLSCDTAP